MARTPKILLIDYRSSDLSVLGLVNEHVSKIHVLTTIIEEVDDLDVLADDITPYMRSEGREVRSEKTKGSLRQPLA